MEFPKTITDKISETHISAKAIAQRLKTEADEAEKAERVWYSIESFAAKGWPLHLLALIEKEEVYLSKAKADTHLNNVLITDIFQIAKNESERILRRFPALIDEACNTVGLKIDLTSMHPKYTLEDGFFRLDIDEKRRVARLSDHEGRLYELPADIQAIVEIIQREHKRIFGKPFNNLNFLKILRKQYTAILKKEKKPDGSVIPIRHITRNMGKNIKGFRSDEFLIELSKLVEKGPLEIDGRYLNLQQTKDINQGMLLHGVAHQGYIGFIIFQEVGHGSTEHRNPDSGSIAQGNSATTRN